MYFFKRQNYIIIANVDAFFCGYAKPKHPRLRCACLWLIEWRVFDTLQPSLGETLRLLDAVFFVISMRAMGMSELKVRVFDAELST